MPQTEYLSVYIVAVGLDICIYGSSYLFGSRVRLPFVELLAAHCGLLAREGELLAFGKGYSSCTARTAVGLLSSEWKS